MTQYEQMNIVDVLGCREIASGKLAVNCRQSLERIGQMRCFQQVPLHLKEREFSGVVHFDKIFASVWCDYSTIAVGTKDNRLVFWDIDKNPVDFKSIPLPKSESPLCRSNCGIHSIALNPSKSMLACGGDNPSDIALFDLKTLESIAVLSGHRDWSFGVDFLSDDRVVSVSRDRSVNIWSVPLEPTSSSHMPLLSKMEHTSKVRALSVNRNLSHFCSLDVDGMVKSWDYNLRVIHDFVLTEKDELTCMAPGVLHNAVVVGSKSHIALLDQNTGKIIKTVSLHQTNWGIRSLNWNSNMITIGGGLGRLSFYDVRKGSVLTTQDKGEEKEFYLTTGHGWSCRNSIPPAIYTHCFDPSGTRLFVGGGPLMLGVKGCYAALW